MFNLSRDVKNRPFTKCVSTQYASAYVCTVQNHRNVRTYTCTLYSADFTLKFGSALNSLQPHLKRTS